LSDPIWEFSRGEDLVELHRDGSLGDELPKCQAIYVWRWNLRPGPSHHVAARPFADWIARLVETPHGKASNVRLAHYLHLSQLELRGSPLSVTKRTALEQFLSTPGNRAWMKRFLNELAPMSIGLYAGETLNLLARIKQHLDGDTDFAVMVENHPVMEWQALDLHYCDLGPPQPQSTEIRKTLEYLTAVLTVAGFTQRPG
jgi:hypothetical protein